MNSLSVTNIFLILAMTTASQDFTSQSVLQSCNMDQCSGNTRLLFQEMPSPKIAIKKTRIEIHAYDAEVEVIYTSRYRYKAYCYDGGYIDPNTGCWQTEYEVPITIDQARKYANDGKCKIGHECHYGDYYCWGTDAKKCLTDEITEEDGKPNFYKGEWKWMKELYHTCISYWKCTTHKMKARTSILNIKDKTYRFFGTPDMDNVILDNDFYRKGFKTKSGARIYPVLNEEVNPQRYYGEANCYSSGEKDIRCAFHTSEGETGVRISYDSLTGIVRNYKVKVIGEFQTIQDGKITTVVPATRFGPITSQEKSQSVQKAVSLESVKEILDEIHITQMQEIYNTVTNAESIAKINNLLHKTVVFLSKRHPFLLSSLVDKGYKTKWLNDDIFQKCPCYKPPLMPSHTNCYNGWKYQDGMLFKTNNSLGCLSIDEHGVKNSTLFSPISEMDTLLLEDPPLHTSASEDSAWDWLIEQRVKQQLFSENTNEGSSNIMSMLQSLNPFPSWKEVALWFSFTTCLLFWLQLIVSRVQS